MRLLPPVGRPNGGRLGNRKERTGCITCKRRKIKCDEAKPLCFRCTSTNRKCEGFVESELRVASQSPPKSQSPGQNDQSLLSELSLVTSLAHSEREHRAFGHFLKSGAFALGCQPEVELWRRWIPQLSTSESSIRHAAIAMGSLLLQNDTSDKMSSSLVIADDSFATHHYQKAIQSTLQSIQAGRGDARLAGITCLLFFSIEALQGHEHEALQLFERGGRFHLEPGTKAKDPVVGALTDAFTKLAVQWSMFEGSIVNVTEKNTQASEEILNMVHAQKELTRLILLAFNISADGWVFKFSSPSKNQGQIAESEGHINLVSRKRALEGAFNDWHERFDAYLKNDIHPADPVGHEIICRMLLLRFRSVHIWLIGSTDLSEMIYDNCYDLFKKAIAAARVMLDTMEQSGRIELFSSELALIPSLYIIATKCRDCILRREALALLRRAPAQEGLWNRNIVMQVSERAIDLEEGSDGFIDELPPDMANMIVPETMRLKIIKIGMRTTNEHGRKGDFVEFHSLPYGFDGNWCVTREFFAA